MWRSHKNTYLYVQIGLGKNRITSRFALNELLRVYAGATVQTIAPLLRANTRNVPASGVPDRIKCKITDRRAMVGSTQRQRIANYTPKFGLSEIRAVQVLAFPDPHTIGSQFAAEETNIKATAADYRAREEEDGATAAMN